MKITSTFSPLSCMALMLALLTHQTARADEAELDVPGPGTRSWVATDGGYQSSRFNAVDGAGNKLGDEHATTKSITVQGNLAVHERINIQLLATRDVTHWTDTYMGFGYSGSNDRNLAMLGFTARPWGSATADGFGLVGGLQASNAQGEAPVYSGNVQPSYRFNNQWLAFMELGLSRGENYRERFGQASLLWKVLPNLSLVPAAGWSSIQYNSGRPAQHVHSFSLNTIYHLNHNLSFLVSAELWQAGDTNQGFTRLVDHRSTELTLGVRWAF